MNGTIIRQCIIILAFAIALVAVGTTPSLAQSPLRDFGGNEAELKSNIVNALVRGDVSIYPYRDAFKAASPSERAAFVRSVFAMVKAYTESEAFQTEYAKQRASAKPSAPPVSVSPDEQYAKFLAEAQKGLTDMKEQVAQMPPDIQTQMESTVKAMEEFYAQYENNPDIVAMIKQGFAEQAEYAQQAYNEKLGQYEKRYPDDPEVLIVKRLREFLELTNDIPYNAKLESGDNRIMRFADPSLEAKSLYWKLCFRAGKEPVETARELAKEWLKQLEQ